MELSLMTFSMIKDGMLKELNADKLCWIAEQNDIHQLDMMGYEIEKIYGGAEIVKAALDEHHMTLGCLIYDVDFILQPDRAENELEKALDLCDKMGTKNLMITPGNLITPMQKKSIQKYTRMQMMEMAIEFFSKAVKKASARGITVGLEDTPQLEKPFVTVKQLTYLFKHVPGLKLIFDIGNILVGDPKTDPFPYYEALKPYIMRVHVKEVVLGHFPHREKCNGGLEILPVMPGAGVMQLRPLLKKIRDDGYDDGLAIEYAEPKGVSGMDNAGAVKPYADWIRDVWNDEDELPPYQKIEGIDKPVSRIFFGTAMMPVFTGKKCDEIFDQMYALGINAFDCARGYGMAEKSLGTWVKDRNNRDKVVILTKCGNVSITGKVHINRSVMEKELETSLKTLQMDYVDIFLLHRDDPNTPVSEYIDTMNDFVREGKIRVFGVSNWTKERIEEANTYAAEHDLQPFTISSPNFGLAEQVEDPWGGDCVTISGDANAPVREWYAKNQMPVLAYSSLARGFFSGRFKAGDWDGARKVLDKAGKKGYLYQVNMDRLARCEELAAKKGCSVAQIAISYIFSNDMNLFALVSTSKQSRMKENIWAANHLLTEEEVAYLEAESHEMSAS